MNLGDAAVRPPVGKRMKARAPPPPRPPQPTPRRFFRNVPDGGGSSGGDSKENILRPSVDLHITLPTGYKTTVNVDGRKALMDLLVDLCSQYHLNPAYHTLELLSPDAQHVSFKPNALLGALDISCALIKERVLEDKVVQKPPPKVPEKTVRLVVNYHRCQKAVVRVNPLAPLRMLVPVICQKCEFDPAHVLLFRDNISHHKLDLDKSLSELSIRELYVLDQTLVLQPKMASTPALNYSESLHSNSQSLSGSEKRGLLGFLKFNSRKSKGLSLVASGPCGETRPSTLGQSQSVMNISRMSPKVELKKRRAPAPPPAPTQTMPLTSQIHHVSQSSHNQLTKRKAPAPPPTPLPSTPKPVIPTPEPTAAVWGPSMPVPVERILLQSPATTSPADDSASDLSHSIEDSELSGSICSSSGGDDVAGGSCSSSLAEEPLAHQAHVIAAYTISKPEAEPCPPVPIEQKEEAAPHTMTKQEPSPTSEDTEAALEIKMDEMENNRNSGIAWLHSGHKTVLEKKAEQEVETVSLASNESFADQGYAASEGMSEEPGPVSLSGRIQSDVGIMSLNSGSALCVKQSKDSSSDSDEGCATWGSRHSANTQRGHQPVKRHNSYEDDPKITAQIHLTLTDLDANLEDIIQSDGASDLVDNEIPVSIVDMDIPVTTIDEVPDDNRYSMSEFKTTLLCSTQNVIRQSCTPCEAIQTKNNNACLTKVKNLSPSSATQKQSQNIKLTGVEKNVSPSSVNQKWSKETKLTDDKEQKVVLKPDTNNKAEIDDLKSQKDILSQKPQGPAVHQTGLSVKNIPENRLKPAPMVRRHSTETANEDTRPINRAPATKGKITQISFSRFGTKTFTVIPPKPAVSQTTKPVGSLVIGAIKIDEQGNMVTKRMITTAPEKHCSPEGATCATESSQGKAKAFWSPAEKQDQSSTTNQGPVVKNNEADVVKPSLVSGVSKLSEKSLPEEAIKEINVLEKNSISVVACKPLIPEPVENSYFTGEKRDLSFLKPSRRTSSQYVASAIAKNNGFLSTKIDSIPEPTESNVGVQKLRVYQHFNNEIRPTNTLPVGLHKPATAFKPTESSVPSFAGPKRSLSYPSHVAEKSKGSEQISSVDKGTLHGGDRTKSMDSQSIYNKVQPSIYISTHIIPFKSSSEEDASINKFQDTSSPRQMLTDTTRPPLTKKPELNKSEIPSEPNQGNTFGPVKKFKPVDFKPVQKETSLHSSLMEAIRSREGIESLKKVSDCSSSYIAKNPSFIDVESEHSALLSAIRAPRNSTRLKKTKSGAAKELEQIKKAEEDRNVQRDIISPPTTPPPAFTAPQPPAFSPTPPPPPPPPPAPSKPLLVLPAVRNPEVAREALLEAIRSGSGAQRLRKVPVTHTRRQVNGRLGTIQARLPLSHGH
ncbi:protein cordon-bleu-like isoform X2 [Xyrauchen texanus]|uniref:protein cordon-bleu-like isoform X2 n=1 Tax=Xyrauchen texanus TaxID=154827 RepID=UPI0022427BE2|nr:protein cordon-bleu-like isoform X2 [Xyrauchen texanus]